MGQKSQKRVYSKLSFSLEDEEKIINFVKEHAELYDPKNGQFKNKGHKDKLWNDLAITFKNDTLGSDCSKKWTNMRDAYMRSKNKKLGSGSAAHNIPRDESMSFLSEIKTTNTRFVSVMLNV